MKKINKNFYTEVISEELEPYYDEKKHGSVDNFIDIISKSIDETVNFYLETYDIDEDDFDNEVFESDLLSDAKKAIKEYNKK